VKEAECSAGSRRNQIMNATRKIITVFGSSRPEDGHADYVEALELGRALAAAGFSVCTGGYTGVMEAVSRGASESGGRVLAVTSTFFRSRTNRWVEEETRVATWQERLFELVRLGDGYVACKGGTGTLVELAVVWAISGSRFWTVCGKSSAGLPRAGASRATRLCIRQRLPRKPRSFSPRGSPALRRVGRECRKRVAHRGRCSRI
jgi:uncharacterized protein (TIGR00725 family)